MSSKIIAGTTSGTALNMSADTSGILEIQTGSTPSTAITVDASQVVSTTGNLGVGTTSPTARLQIGDGTVNTANIVVFGKTQASTEANLPYIYCASSSGAGNDLNIVARSTSGALIFKTSETFERMRVESNGYVTVNGAVTDGRVSVQENLTAQNGISVKNTVSQTGTQWFINFRNSSNGNAGNIAHTGTSTVAYNTSSDYRLKENVAPMTGALETVSKLKPVTYTWIEDKKAGQGFIAHELQAIVPDCVTGEKDAVDEEGNPIHQGIDTSFLVATLTAAIQELNAKVTALEAQLGAK